MKNRPKSRGFFLDNRAITDRSSSCHQGGDDSSIAQVIAPSPEVPISELRQQIPIGRDETECPANAGREPNRKLAKCYAAFRSLLQRAHPCPLFLLYTAAFHS